MTDPVEPTEPFEDADEFAALRQSSTSDDVGGPNFAERLSERLGELDPRLVVGIGVAALGIVTIIGFIALLSLARGRPRNEQPTVVVAVTSQPTLTPSITFTNAPSLTPSLTPIISDTPVPIGSATVDLTRTITNIPDVRFATLSEIKGSVEIRIAADQPFKRVNETLTITPGSTVLTGENSSAKVTMSDGSIIRLSSQTQLTLVEMTGTVNRPNTVLGLDFGKVWAIVGGIGEGIFQIKLPVGVASVRGTFMSAESNSNDKIEIVTCLEGKCAYRNANGQVQLGALQQTESINGGPPSTPHKMDQSQLDDWAKAKIPEVVTLTPTKTPTSTRTNTRTPSVTPTASNTGTATSTGTVTRTGTLTTTTTVTTTLTLTLTRTNTATTTPTRTSTPTSTPTTTPTPTPTATTGAPHHLEVNIQPPANVQAATDFTMQVTIKDSAGITVTTATNTITLAISNNPSSGTLSSVSSLTQSPVSGIVTFNNLRIDKAGTGYTLIASASPSLPANTITTNAFNITPGVVDHFGVSVPGTVTACSSFNATVTAYDINNNIDVNYTGTIVFSTGDGSSYVILPGNYSFVASDAGVKTFSGLRLFTDGSQSVNIADGSYVGSGSTTVGGIGGADHLVVSGISNPATVGTPEAVTVTALNACNVVDTGYAGTVQFSSDDTSATLPTPSSLTSGTGSFSVTFNTAGTFFVQAADTVTTSINGQQTGITVNSP